MVAENHEAADLWVYCLVPRRNGTLNCLHGA